MKVTTFRLRDPDFIPEGDPIFGAQKAVYKIPTLPAYALIDLQLQLDHPMHIDAGHVPVTFELLHDGIAVPNRYWSLLGASTGLLTVYHNGIKDFELLFPHVMDDSLRGRIGRFAEEANKAFESQSWISYSLMVGGVLEGLLYNEYGNLNLHELTQEAVKFNLITAEEALLIDNIRVTRNKIHANKHREEIADRKAALELSTAYDRLIKRSWSAVSNN